LTIWGRKETTTDTDPGLLEGLRLYDARDYAGSVKFLLVKARTGDPFAAFKLANALSEIGQERAAVAFWELAIAGGNNSSLNNLGNFFRDRDYLEKAFELHVKCSEGGSDDAMHSAGVLASELGRVEESVFWLNRGIEAGNLRCYGALGMDLHESGKTSEAIEVLQRGVENASLSAVLWLALVYIDLGDKEKARATIAKAPSDDEVEFRERHLIVQVEKLKSSLS
jgi:tetratricopeptide (TPR) repeat protein